jgi:hypothetical protein
MKQFKRKIARLFSLALRSDLDRMHSYYQKECERHVHYFDESIKYKIMCAEWVALNKKRRKQ